MPTPKYRLEATEHGVDIFKNNAYIKTLSDEYPRGKKYWIAKGKEYIKSLKKIDKSKVTKVTVRFGDQPDWANYLTMDYNGTSMYWEFEPTALADNAWWCARGRNCVATLTKNYSKKLKKIK